MNSEVLLNQLIQYAASSIYSFLLFSIIIEASFKLFRIKNHRFRATARLLLPLKLSSDPLTFALSKKWMLINVNIFGCAHPLQSFLFKRFCGCPEDPGHIFGLNIHLKNFLRMIPHTGHLIFISLFSSYTLFCVLMLLARYMRSRSSFKSIMKTAKPLLRPIENIRLIRNLALRKVSLVTSENVKIPFAGFGNVIVLPESLLDTLSQTELEAIICHELEHLSWKDSASRIFCQAISAFFWWIPFKNWNAAIEHEQELASDQSVNRYQLDGRDLAYALKKTLIKHLGQPENFPAFMDSKYVSGRDNLFERFRLTLYPQPKEACFLLKTLSAALLIASAAILIGFRIC